MKLHENKELFAEAIQAAAQSKEDGGIGIKPIYIKELPDLAYKEIPSAEKIEESVAKLIAHL